MSENIFIQLWEKATPEQRNEVFGLVQKMPQIKFVCDLGSITREVLDEMLLPTPTKQDRGAKIIYAKSERARREPEPITRPKSLKERLSG